MYEAANVELKKRGEGGTLRRRTASNEVSQVTPPRPAYKMRERSQNKLQEIRCLLDCEK